MVKREIVDTSSLVSLMEGPMTFDSVGREIEEVFQHSVPKQLVITMDYVDVGYKKPVYITKVYMDKLSFESDDQLELPFNYGPKIVQGELKYE